MNDNSKKLAIVILIGGKSLRFEIATPLVDYLGKPLILHQVEKLVKFDEDLFLVAHTEDEVNKYVSQVKFPRKVKFLIDDVETYADQELRTPMLGIYSAFKELNNLNFQKALLISGDMPLLKPEVIQLMIREAEGYDCCIPRWNNDFLEPLLAIYPVKNTYENTKRKLEQKNYALSSIIDSNWNIKYVSVEKSIQLLDENLVSLINVNGPVDLEKLMKLYDT